MIDIYVDYGCFGFDLGVMDEFWLVYSGNYDVGVVDMFLEIFGVGMVYSGGGIGVGE